MKEKSYSYPSPIYASEDSTFKLELLLEDKAVDLSDFDIQVECFTSQLSPRGTVRSFSSGLDAYNPQGASIIRFSDYYLLKVSSPFLDNFPTGVLTLSCHYTNSQLSVTNVVRVGKFINDYPANSVKVIQ